MESGVQDNALVEISELHYFKNSWDLYCALSSPSENMCEWDEF